MKKEVILTLFALASITLAGCAQADKSAFESSVAETAPTVTTVAAAETVPETTTVTASSETTATTVTTAETTTASEVTTTAKETKKQPSSEATTTKKKTVTTSKKATTVTTTVKKKPVTTTTTKAKPKVTTTTTAKKKPVTTTTAKKASKADDKYKLTGVLASYYRFYAGEQTAADEKAIRDDILSYTMDKFNGKSGNITFYTDGKMCIHNDCTKTLNVPFEINIDIDESLVGIECAHYESCFNQQPGLFNIIRNLSPEEKYNYALRAQDMGRAVMDAGLFRLLHFVVHDVTVHGAQPYIGSINIWIGSSYGDSREIWFTSEAGGSTSCECNRDPNEIDF